MKEQNDRPKFPIPTELPQVELNLDQLLKKKEVPIFPYLDVQHPKGESKSVTDGKIASIRRRQMRRQAPSGKQSRTK